ncbi:hypothetical protein KKP91_02325 [Methanothermococcus sp. SCGC AD-155-M21]|nr:hypothetical protein [Methanothermococcus sp. SCGC AD-155-M21]
MYAQGLKYYPFLQKFLQEISFSPFNDITSLFKDFKKPKSLLEEKEEKLLPNLIQIAPEKVTEESYEKAIKKLDEYLTSEIPPTVEGTTEIAEKEYLTPEELEEEVLNILTPKVLELKKQTDEMNKSLWEKALSEELTEEEIKQFEFLDKLLFLESNILGIIVESRDIEVVEELIGYYLILLLRVIKIIEKNRNISELKDDFKVVDGKIKSIIQEIKALDDYFIDELLEE